ncbi:MAG TPA: hypothetical protein VIM06_05405 [Rhodanobacter sp.]
MKGFARIALAWAACMLLFACQSHQDNDLSQLGSPSQRLLGHWGDASGDNLYYGPRDAVSGIGSFIMSHPDSRLFKHHYKVINEDPATQTINVNLLFVDGDSRTETDVVAANGAKLTTGTLLNDHYISGTLDRVDDATAPETYADADGSIHVYDVTSAPVPVPAVRQKTQLLSSQPGAVVFVRQQAVVRVFSYILWLHATAAAILLVLSLMYFRTLGLPTILAHWAVALSGGLVCVFLLHSMIGAGIFEILVSLVLLTKALFPKSSF